jgi:hypothetical protein
MPKQSDDLTRDGEESQETPNSKLKIPVPTREQISSALRRASRRQPDEDQQSSPPDPEKR